LIHRLHPNPVLRTTSTQGTGSGSGGVRGPSFWGWHAHASVPHHKENEYTSKQLVEQHLFPGNILDMIRNAKVLRLKQARELSGTLPPAYNHTLPLPTGLQVVGPMSADAINIVMQIRGDFWQRTNAYRERATPHKGWGHA
jgi:hypothetical protein